MGIFDFFRKKEEKKIEEVRFEELESFLGKKKKDHEKKQEELLKLINERIALLNSDFEKEIIDLRKIDLAEKKVEEQLKSIVLDNLNKYTSFLESLNEDLRSLKEKDPEKIVKQIDELFINFDKMSFRIFHRATILIGDEMARVKNSISLFFRDLRKILEEHKETIDHSRLLSIVEKAIKETQEIKTQRKEYDRILFYLNENKKAMKNNITKIEGEIETIKKSKEYLDSLESNSKLAKDKEELKKEINGLKNLVDFKEIQRIFHTNEKIRKILDAYAQNFYEEFNKDRGEEFLRIVREANIDSVQLASRINELNQRAQQLASLDLREDITLVLIKELSRLRLEEEEINKELEKETKNYNNLDERLVSIRTNLSLELEKFGLALI